MKYQVICADPPWHFNDGLTAMKDGVKRAAQSQYSTLTLKEIVELDVKSIADPRGCLLALWTPSTMLEDGLRVMKAWGFSMKQTFVWVKLKKDHAKESDLNMATRFGMGRLFRQAHEIALIGTYGKSIYPFLEDKSQRSVAFDLNEGHSVKPPSLQDRLDIMFPNVSKIEMFARRDRPGWTCVGDGVTGRDVRDSLHEIANDLPLTRENLIVQIDADHGIMET